ncbi:MAG: LamG domain-containing protein [Rhodanobacter sp.]
MTNASVLVTARAGNGDMAALDLAVGRDGRLADSANDAWMSSSGSPLDLSLPPMPFFGTAVELNGRSDYFQFPDLTDSSAGAALQAWVRPAAGVEQEQCVLELALDSSTFYRVLLDAKLNLQVQFQFGAGTAPSTNDCEGTGPLSPLVWANLAIVLESSGNITAYLNGRQVHTLGFGTSHAAFSRLQASVGRSVLGVSYFAGTISEIRLATSAWKSMVQAYLGQPAPNAWGMQYAFALDEGKGTGLANGINAMQYGDVMKGGRWVAAASPSRTSMLPTGDLASGRWLPVRVAMLGGLSPSGQASLVAGSDGLVRMHYRRASDAHWGIAHYDTRTQRAQAALAWQGRNERQSRLKLMLTALQAGTCRQYCAVSLSSDGNGLLCLTMNGNTLAGGNAPSETWAALPARLSSIVDIVNGSVPDAAEEPDAPRAYDYGAHLTRMYNGTRVTEDQLPARQRRHASMLFAANGIHQLDEELDQPVPDGGIDVSYTAGADTRWLLNPIPAAVREPGLILDPAAEGKLQLAGDVTMECWVCPDGGNGNYSLFAQRAGGTPYAMGFDGHGRLWAGKAAVNLQGGSGIDRVTVAVRSAQDVAAAGRWMHLAASYRSSWGLHLHKGAYVKCSRPRVVSSSAMTVEAWVRPDAFGREQSVLTQRAQDGHRFNLSIRDDGTPTFSVVDEMGGRQEAEGGQRLVAGQWAHLSGVYRATDTLNMLYFASPSAYAGVLDLQGTSPDLTIEAWVRPLDKGNGAANATILSCGRADGEHALLSLGLDYNGQVILSSYESVTQGNQQQNTLHRMGFGEYIPFASSIDDPSADTQVANVIQSQGGNSTCWLYINGVMKNEQTYPYPSPSAVAAAGWTLGAEMDGSSSSDEGNDGVGNHYKGGMHHVRLWSVARTEQQIVDHLDAPVQIGEPGLRGEWKLDSTPRDMSGFGDDIVIQPLVTNSVGATSVSVKGDGASYRSCPAASMLKLYLRTSQMTAMASTGGTFGKIADSSAPVYMGKADAEDADALEGAIDDVRIWNTARLSSQIDYYTRRPLDDPKGQSGLAAYWNFDEGSGQQVSDASGGDPGVIMGVRDVDTAEDDAPYWIPTPVTAVWTLWADGEELEQASGAFEPPSSSSTTSSIGPFRGAMNEIRVWDAVRTEEQISALKNQPLRGDESGLVAYWPCTDNPRTQIAGNAWLSDLAADPCDAQYHAGNTYINAQTWAAPGTSLAYPAPISGEASYIVDASNGVMTEEAQRTSLSAAPASAERAAAAGRVNAGILEDGTTLQLDAREDVDATEMIYLGQIQTHAQIVGFIEGAPPVPSENLGVELPSNPNKYGGTSRVTLEQGDEIVYSGVTKLEGGLTGALEVNGGEKESAEVGFAIPSIERIAEQELDLKADLDLEGKLMIRNVATARFSQEGEKSAVVVADGGFEQNLYNIGGFGAERIGVQPKRIYRPGNMGAAIVRSLVADFYAVRSKRTGATVGYVPVANPDIPPDTNVIMFKINPAYVKNGTLDGHIGFDTDVSYPTLSAQDRGSYYKVQEAYATKARIQRQKTDYANYFSSLGAMGAVSQSKDQWLAKVANRSMVNTYVWTAEGGQASEEISQGASRREALGLSFDVGGSLGREAHFEGLLGYGLIFGYDFNAKLTVGLKLEGTHTSASADKSTFKLESEVEGEHFLAMQAIPIDVAMPSGVEWSARPSSRTDRAYLSPSDPLTAALIEAGAVTRIRVSYQALSEQEAPASSGFYSDSEGTWTTRYTIFYKDGEWYLEDIGGKYLASVGDISQAYLTPFNESGQYPINYLAEPCPGKVLGYRYMSFYLEPNVENFKLLRRQDDPDTQIIDKDWLDNPDDPNAVALKDALTRTNDVWRVYHRVTYVNRVPPEQEEAEEGGSTERDVDGSDGKMAHVALPNTTVRPDPISMARNGTLIRVLLGDDGNLSGAGLPDLAQAGDPPSQAIIDDNIAVLVRSLSLGKLASQKLANQLHDYMKSCIAGDSLVAPGAAA